LPAGPHVVTFEVAGEFIGYLNIVRMPAGLSDEERQRQMFAAGVEDLPQPVWTYFGGTNTPDVGETATFIADLEPGEYEWAASTYVPEQELAEGEAFEEEFHFAPLAVVEAADGEATPAADAEPAATVELEMTDDLRYLVSPERVPAGPQLWRIANTGQHHAHHVVMFRVPNGTTAEQISGEFTSLMSGTPPAGEPADGPVHLGRLRRAPVRRDDDLGRVRPGAGDLRGRPASSSTRPPASPTWRTGW
jgi:hypothetical protein